VAGTGAGKATDFAIRRAIDRSPIEQGLCMNSMIAVVDEAGGKSGLAFPHLLGTLIS